MKRNVKYGKAKIKNRNTNETVKNVRNKLKLVGNIFSTEDLREAMNNRKVFGKYAHNKAKKIIYAARKFNFIKRINNGYPGIYKKLDKDAK